MGLPPPHSNYLGIFLSFKRTFAEVNMLDRGFSTQYRGQFLIVSVQNRPSFVTQYQFTVAATRRSTCKKYYVVYLFILYIISDERYISEGRQPNWTASQTRPRAVNELTLDYRPFYNHRQHVSIMCCITGVVSSM